MFSIEDSLRSARLHSLFSDKKAHPFDELTFSTSPRRGQSVSPRRQAASSSPVSVLSAPSPLPLLTPKRRRVVDEDLDEFEAQGPLKRRQPSSLRAEFSSPAVDLDSDTDADMDPLTDTDSEPQSHSKAAPPSLGLRPSAARVRARATAFSAADLEAVESLMGIKHASPAPVPPSPPQLAARVWPRGPEPVPALAVSVAVPTARPFPVQARAVEPSAFSLLPPAAVAALPVPIASAAPVRATAVTRAEAVSISVEAARPLPVPAHSVARPVLAHSVARPVPALPVPQPVPVPALAVAAAAVPALPLPSSSSPASAVSPAPVPVQALAVSGPAVVRAKPLPLPVVSARVVTAATPVPSRVLSVTDSPIPVPAQVLRCEDRMAARVVGRVVTPAELLQVRPASPAVAVAVPAN